MKIFAVDPIGANGHRNFNTSILQVLRNIGELTFVAPHGYLSDSSVTLRIDIPQSLTRYRSKIGARWSQIRVLKFILKKINLDDYDAVIFLAYETISFCLCWPRNKKAFVFDHNNIENSYRSHVKRAFYRNLSKTVCHFVFLPYIKEYIEQNTQRRVFLIPHPHYREEAFKSPEKFLTSLTNKSDFPLKIFSPSGSTPKNIQQQLKSFVSICSDKYYAICKDVLVEKSSAWETRDFFVDYEQYLSSCDMVFVGAKFMFRVSGVVYESLSYGKPVILFNSPFAMELRNENPGLVFVIKDINEIQKVNVDLSIVKKAHGEFLRRHSFDAILSKMETAFIAKIPKDRKTR